MPLAGEGSSLGLALRGGSPRPLVPLPSMDVSP